MIYDNFIKCKVLLQEKLDILEEHVAQLMQEIKKKNRVIQNYYMNLETGALVSEESDIHKVCNYYCSSMSLLTLILTLYF